MEGRLEDQDEDGDDVDVDVDVDVDDDDNDGCHIECHWDDRNQPNAANLLSYNKSFHWMTAQSIFWALFHEALSW